MQAPSSETLKCMITSRYKLFQLIDFQEHKNLNMWLCPHGSHRVIFSRGESPYRRHGNPSPVVENMSIRYAQESE